MIFKNNKGLTLVELLLTLAISLSIMVLVSSMLFQSFRSKEISDTHVNLRQEANLILSMFTSAQVSGGGTTFDISYQRINAKEWEIKIGNQEIANPSYDISLEMVVGSNTTPIIIDPITIQQISMTINKKQKLNIKSLTLIDKRDPNNKFEISSVISRL